jgi:hypothetical protein
VPWDETRAEVEAEAGLIQEGAVGEEILGLRASAAMDMSAKRMIVTLAVRVGVRGAVAIGTRRMRIGGI